MPYPDKENGELSAQGGDNSDTVSVAPHLRHTRNGRPYMVDGLVRKKPRKPNSDLWLDASPMRHIVHLLAAFHEDASREVPGGKITDDTFDAWWDIVEERDWHNMSTDLDWLTEFLRPIRNRRNVRQGHGGVPPMVRSLQAEAAKRLGTYEPSLTFRRYQLMRPDIYQHFKRIAEERLKAGYNRCSAYTILEELRAEGVKHSAMDLAGEYARKLVSEDERFAQFFIFGAIRKRAE